MLPRALLSLLFCLALAGCGEATGLGSDPLAGYVSVREAKDFFRIEYGIPHWNCTGHGLIDRATYEFATSEGDAPKVPLFNFVACKTIYVEGKQARQDGIWPGEELTYGF
jgi:hypothetical protein